MNPDEKGITVRSFLVYEPPFHVEIRKMLVKLLLRSLKPEKH